MALWEGMVLRKSMSANAFHLTALLFYDDSILSHDGRHSYGIDETVLDRAFDTDL